MCMRMHPASHIIKDCPHWINLGLSLMYTTVSNSSVLKVNPFWFPFQLSSSISISSISTCQIFATSICVIWNSVRCINLLALLSYHDSLEKNNIGNAAIQAFEKLLKYCCNLHELKWVTCNLMIFIEYYYYFSIAHWLYELEQLCINWIANVSFNLHICKCSSIAPELSSCALAK